MRRESAAEILICRLSASEDAPPPSLAAYATCNPTRQPVSALFLLLAANQTWRTPRTSGFMLKDSHVPGQKIGSRELYGFCPGSLPGPRFLDRIPARHRASEQPKGEAKMLTRTDDFLCHQTASIFDHPKTSARKPTKRTWLSVHDIQGELSLVNSFGYHPSRNITDSCVSVTVEGKTAHTVRASRDLRPQTGETRAGPVRLRDRRAVEKGSCALQDG